MKAEAIAQALQQTALFQSLNDGQSMELGKRARLLHLVRGQMLFVAGEPAIGMYVIVTGSLRATRESIEGREQVIHVDRAGASIAEVPMFDEESYPSSVTAEEDSTVLFLARADVRAACLEHPEIAMAALKILARRLRGCAALVESLSLQDVDRRLALFLQAMSKDSGQIEGKHVAIELSLTHQQIAARIGSVREVVSRAMGRLQKNGWIEVSGARIVIQDPTSFNDYIRGKIKKNDPDD